MRPIDADALYDAATGFKKYYIIEPGTDYLTAYGYHADDVLSTIHQAHTLDVEPIKHGEWIPHPAWRDEDGCLVYEYYCSLCDRYINVYSERELKEYPYCHCGAKMDLEG